MCQYHFAIVLFLVSTVNACDENYTTSVPSLRIVDGYRCLPEDYPYLVSIRRRGHLQWCGGSLLTSTWVLTAGHCCDKTFANEHSILAGLTKYRSNEQWSLVRKLFVHPHFNLDPMRNDICLMQLYSQINETSTVRYVKLVSERTWKLVERVGARGVVIGFGTQAMVSLDKKILNPEKPYDPHLQCVNLTILPKHVCRTFDPLLHESLFCAHGGDNESSNDACQGDSGGPFMANNGTQLGVVSTGYGCGLGFPAFYTRVDMYFDFLHATIRNVASSSDKHLHNVYTFRSVCIVNVIYLLKYFHEVK